MQSIRRRLGLICLAVILCAFVYFMTANTHFFGDYAGRQPRNFDLHSRFNDEQGPNIGLCSINGSNSLVYNANTKIQMLDVYEHIPFDNYTLLPSGWLQGFSIKYDAEEIKKQARLEVIVVPHSHCDPGWLNTFEGYYMQYTDSIHTVAMKFLNSHENMSFIFAEMSFLEMWWRLHKEKDRQALKNVIDKGQLEIVTGGWVMTDEANSHYFATIMELIEGHEFLKNHLDYVPENHWSIDPFGLSPTLAYLIKSSGLKHMVIQRAHYAVKKYLAERKQLEFMWRQLWAGEEDQIFTHLMPFDSYDLTKTCGPDPEVCCQFDFRRIGELCRSPTSVPIQAINQHNLEEKAVLLADQFRKKAQLYKESVVLVPHGEDFRYNTDMEWVLQHENLGKLFEYINKNEERFNIRARFGTLKDYFKILEKRLVQNRDAIPTLSGDFFTYADRFDHYWSGYYTSRPFYKHMDRTLQQHVRTADILFSLANQKRQLSKNSLLNVEKEEENDLFSMFTQLVDARRALSLFQHHDGVAGTAKDFVMQDYAVKMASAIASSKRIIEKSSMYLLNISNSDSSSPEDRNILRIDEDHFAEKLPLQATIQLGSTLLLFNPLAFDRKEVLCVFVNTSMLKVMAFDDDEQMTKIKDQQVHPVFQIVDGVLTEWLAEKPKFELCFMAELPAIGFRNYLLAEIDADESDPLSFVKISFKGQVNMRDMAKLKKINAKETLIEISNGLITSSFSLQSGFLRSIKPPLAQKANKVNLSFVVYGVRKTSYANFSSGSTITSGAYLFLPDGPAKNIDQRNNSFVVVDGPVRKSVIVRQAGAIHILHKVDLDIGAESLQIRNLVDIRSVVETEVAMNLDTNETEQKPLDSFYTELNGYQMIRRRKFKNLPIQAHFYPMPGSAFLENDQKRMSLVGRQALGVASLQPGMLEVILDRRLNHDDDRGLEAGVLDNCLTESRFRLLFEKFSESNHANPSNNNYLKEATTSFSSLLAHHSSLQLHYPMVTMFSGEKLETALSISFLKIPFPCDTHLVALRSSSHPTLYSPEGENAANKKSTTEARPSAALVLHRLGLECRLLPLQTPLQCAGNEHVLVHSLFMNGRINRVANASLTLMQVDQVVEKELKLKPMEIKTWQLDF